MGVLIQFSFSLVPIFQDVFVAVVVADINATFISSLCGVYVSFSTFLPYSKCLNSRSNGWQ